VTIPAEIRARLGLHPGALVRFSVEAGAVLVGRATGVEGRGDRLVARLRGSARTALSTDEMMTLTRGDSPIGLAVQLR